MQNPEVGEPMEDSLSGGHLGALSCLGSRVRAGEEEKGKRGPAWWSECRDGHGHYRREMPGTDSRGRHL